MRGIKGTWQKPSSILELNHDEIHIWRAASDFKKNHLALLKSFLSPDEKAKAAKFHFVKDFHQSIVSRGLLRFLLAQYLKQNPRDFVFKYNSYGKPILPFRQNPLSIEFNVSHSGKILLFAFSREFRIGIDVELVRKNFDEMEIARNFFSPNEILELTSLPVAIRKKGFYNCWTRKEAYIKGRGKGLSIPLDSFDVSLAPGKSAVLNRSEAELEGWDIWQLLDLKLDRDYVGAAAFEGRNRRIMFLEWDYSAINEQEG